MVYKWNRDVMRTEKQLWMLTYRFSFYTLITKIVWAWHIRSIVWSRDVYTTNVFLALNSLSDHRKTRYEHSYFKLKADCQLPQWLMTCLEIGVTLWKLLLRKRLDTFQVQKIRPFYEWGIIMHIILFLFLSTSLFYASVSFGDLIFFSASTPVKSLWQLKIISWPDDSI